MNSLFIGLACIVLISAVLYELFKDQYKTVEKFEDTPNYFTKYYPKRSDIVPGQVVEDGGWLRDIRYKQQYVDLQKIGMKADFCRVIMRRGDPGSMIMACALAGTDGTTSRSYTTKSKQEGFKFSRDDYFRDVNSDLRDDYCRIVKISQAPEDRWETRCVIAGLDSFKPQEVRDADPPADIVELLWFYESIMIWYRFKDDLLDYGENTQLSLAGGLSINEDPSQTKYSGFKINAIPQGDAPAPVADQFVRIGENKELEFDEKVELRNLRAFCFWVKFDKFTNNARIFDFGNGPGHDNVFFGIEGTGNDTTSTAAAMPSSAQTTDADVVCNAKAPREIAPQRYMAETAANVELYECPGPEPIDPATNPYEAKVVEEIHTKRANLLFEIWDKEQRKMRVRIVDAVQERKWHHIAVTTKDLSFRPTYEVYIDGLKVFTHEDGHLPQTNYTTKNYIGRSNWEESTDQGAYKDERFRGALFDFRMYYNPLSETKILKSLAWGKPQLQ
jgi:hypothetical protein